MQATRWSARRWGHECGFAQRPLIAKFAHAYQSLGPQQQRARVSSAKSQAQEVSSQSPDLLRLEDGSVDLRQSLMQGQAMQRLKDALAGKPAGEEVALNLVRVPAAQRFLSWLLDAPQAPTSTEQTAEYHANVTSALAALDEVITDMRAARLADLLDHIAGLTNYRPVMMSLYSMFNAERAAKLEQHIAAAAPEGARARVAELVAAAWPPARAAKVCAALDPVLNDQRLTEQLSAIDSVLTEARLKRLAEWLTNIEPAIKVERTKAITTAVAPEVTAARVVEAGELLEEFATPDRVARAFDSLAVQISSARLQRYASLVDYAATNDRLQRMAPLVSALPQLITPARSKRVAALLDVLFDRKYVAIVVATLDEYATVERTHRYIKAFDDSITGTRIARWLGLAALLAKPGRLSRAAEIVDALGVSRQEGSIRGVLDMLTSGDRSGQLVAVADAVVTPKTLGNVLNLVDALLSEPRLSNLAAVLDAGLQQPGRPQQLTRAADEFLEGRGSGVLAAALDAVCEPGAAKRLVDGLDKVLEGQSVARFLESLDLALAIPDVGIAFDQLVQLVQVWWELTRGLTSRDGGIAESELKRREAEIRARAGGSAAKNA